MKIIATLNWVMVLLFAITFSNCANEKNPEGGKKDTTPPKVKKMSPPNKSLHFTATKIDITFDEFIKATGFAQTLISPPLDKKPDYKVSGKTLTIKFKSHLRDSTTYTINFAEDIKDLNEGNILNNITYVFSTGAFIDSQKVSGKIILAKDNTPADGVIASLYPVDSINAIRKSKPYYFAKTDKTGNFKINNIKAGQYRIFGLKDQNYDYLYNQPNELIAFSDTILDLRDTLPKTVELRLFEERHGKLSFMGEKAMKPGFVQLYFSQPLKSLTLESNISTDKDFYYFNATKATINYWYSAYSEKRAKLFLVANDTLKDSVRITLQNITADSIIRNRKYALTPDFQLNKGASAASSKEIINTQELFKPLKISFTYPITGINSAKAFHLFEDSVKKDLPVKFSIDSPGKQALVFDFPKTENTNYTLDVPDSAFQDLFGTWNTAFKYKFKTTSKDNYGNLNVILKSPHPEKNYIVKILDASTDALIAEIHIGNETEKKLLIENVPAGTYKIIAIDEANNNGVWDTGNFKEKIQPERIITFKDTYNLKGGWDLDIEVRL